MIVLYSPSSESDRSYNEVVGDRGGLAEAVDVIVTKPVLQISHGPCLVSATRCQCVLFVHLSVVTRLVY